MIALALLLGLAAWRLALLVTEEEGPFNLFGRLRRLAGVPPSREDPIEGFLPLLFSCIYCLSGYMAAAVYGLYLLEPRAVLVLAAWGVAAGFQRLLDRIGFGLR